MGDQNKLCILIATSQPSIRSGLRVFLNEQSDLYVIAEAQDGHELLKKVEATCPDVILLDWGLLDRSTPILIKTIGALDRKSAVIVLSAESDHQQTAMDSGADAFVKIGDPPRELLEVINNLVESGNSF
jgi:two-component system response regulator NreC